MTSIIGTIVSISVPTKKENELPYLKIEVQSGDVKAMVTIRTSHQSIQKLLQAHEATVQANAMMAKSL